MSGGNVCECIEGRCKEEYIADECRLRVVRGWGFQDGWMLLSALAGF